MNLVEELKALTDSLNSANIDYALCGGLAMAVYGRPRATLDLDIIIEATDLERVCDLAVQFGFLRLAQPMEFKGGKIKIDRLTKISELTHEVVVLDMLIVTDAIRAIWNNRRLVKWAYGEICIVSPEGLIDLKSFRSSGQDLEDIEFLKGISHED